MTVATMDAAGLNPLFKRQFLPLQNNMFTTYGNVWGMIRKTYGKGGDELKGPIQNTFGGGVGSSPSGILPEAFFEEYLDPTYTWKRSYAKIEIDGLAIAASRGTEKAYINLMEKATINKMISFNRYYGGMILFNDGTGTLGQFSGNQAGTAAAPVVTVLNTGTYGYRKGYFEKGDMVNVNTDASVFRITAVNHTTRAITLARISGSLDLTAIGVGTHTIYMQNSKDAEPYGFKGIIDNSTHYGIAEEYRYAPTEVDAGGAPLEDEMLVELAWRTNEDTDEFPNLLVFSPLQMRNYLKLQEAKKRIPVTMSRKPGKNNIASEKAIAKVSYNGIALAAGDGDIMCVVNKYVQDDRIYSINTKYVEALFVGKKPGFQAEDGKTYLRMEGRDSYSAFLAAYGENLINPFHVGAVTRLAVS